MINYTSSGMGNVKCENSQHFSNNVRTAEFASYLTVNACLLLAM